MNDYEWNDIIIENLYDYDTKKFSIKCYLNKNYDKPEFQILDLDGFI